MISCFVKLFFSCAQTTPPEVDFVGDLPEEVSTIILRYLDPESLISASAVNRRWKSICQNDVLLRKRVFIKLRKDRLQRMYHSVDPSKLIIFVREPGVPPPQFMARNVNVPPQKLPKSKNKKTTSFPMSFKASASGSGCSGSKLRSCSKNSNVRNMRM